MGKAERYRNIDMLGYKIFASDINSCLEKVFSMKKVHIVSGNPEVLYVGLNNKELFKNFISDVIFGLDLGIIKEITDKQVLEMQLYTNIGNMQEFLNKNIEINNQDIERANVIKLIINERR